MIQLKNSGLTYLLLIQQKNTHVLVKCSKTIVVDSLDLPHHPVTVTTRSPGLSHVLLRDLYKHLHFPPVTQWGGRSNGHCFELETGDFIFSFGGQVASHVRGLTSQLLLQYTWIITSRHKPLYPFIGTLYPPIF